MGHVRQGETVRFVIRNDGKRLMLLVDTNVLVINPVVYAELSLSFSAFESLDRVLARWH